MAQQTTQQRASCGLDCHFAQTVNESLEEVTRSGYQFACMPIVNPRFKREFLESPAKDRPGPFTRSDLILPGSDWSNLIVGKLSPWLQLDSTNPALRKNSEMAFHQELSYMGHLSLPAIIMKLRSYNCSNLARNLNQHIIGGTNQQVWMNIPMRSPRESVEEIFDDDMPHNEETVKDTWEWWNKFRTICDFNRKIAVALELSADLISEEHIDRWFGEPLKVVILPTNLFLTNKKGYPVLSRAHQSFFKRALKFDVQIIVTGACHHPEKGMRSYVQYVDHLWQSQSPLDPVSLFAKGYEDYLQCPLQPLMDNLESQTYEVFEKDPVKYSQYQKAVYHALLDRIPEEEKASQTCIVMVVGAGRGPLVTASIIAANKAGRKIQVYAVEKNPNAVITLEGMREEEWGNIVTVVSCDMREWKAPVKADIMVSELLGSFSDNELSPECLDGAQDFLKEDGIVIPSKYTSYLAPLQSSKLYNEVRLCKERDKHYEAPYETPYVVRLHNCHLMSPPKPVFEFTHPKWGQIDNTRYIDLEFQIKENCVLHGFAGYFDTVLYKDVTLSIVPETHSQGMFSWFPILFPITRPMKLAKDEKLVVHFWRLVNKKNVWYEWCVSEPRPSPIHNPKGRSYTIGL
ncbi:protein arginine N-methyltransferase 5-like [Lineus longissimus]|uniref:protein arginine N-methyltransferase 5-like n=1 Tax=Lineus longissimus TaxID=88925 RepID=UPI002B4E9993